MESCAENHFCSSGVGPEISERGVGRGGGSITWKEGRGGRGCASTRGICAPNYVCKIAGKRGEFPMGAYRPSLLSVPARGLLSNKTAFPNQSALRSIKQPNNESSSHLFSLSFYL